MCLKNFLLGFTSLWLLFIFPIEASAATSFDNLPSGSQLITKEQPMSLPGLHKSFVDPDFGTTLMKVADPSQLQTTGTAVRHDYSLHDPFNANNTLAIFRTIGEGAWWVYDANTWNPLRRLSQIAQGEPDLYWHPLDPDTVYFVDSEYFKVYHPSKDTYQTLHVFSQCNFAPTNNYYALASGQHSNMSQDGARIAWECKKAGGLNDVIVYDIPNDKILYEGPLPVTTTEFYNITISETGKYFVILVNGTGSTNPDHYKIYDAMTGAYVRDLPFAAHADLGIDVDGSDIVVVDGSDDPNPQPGPCNTPTQCRWIVKFRLADGQRTNLYALPEWGQTLHVSMRAKKVPGWALISTIRNSYIVKYSTSYMPSMPVVNAEDFEIFFLKTDGSGQVRRVAHSRTRRPDDGSPLDDYWNEAHAVVNADASRIVFASPWVVNGVATDKYNGNTSSNAYVIFLTGGTPAPGGTPGTGGTPGIPSTGGKNIAPSSFQATDGPGGCGMVKPENFNASSKPEEAMDMILLYGVVLLSFSKMIFRNRLSLT